MIIEKMLLSLPLILIRNVLLLSNYNIKLKIFPLF